jgi:NitT/TauT family transport system ATP-binding protein
VEVAASSDEAVCITPTPQPERTLQYYGVASGATTGQIHAERNGTVTLAQVPSAVSISNVSKTFVNRGRRGPGRVEALASINLEIESGEAVALLGPSGCGKTTLLRLIAGLDRISSGSITIDGHLPAEIRSRKQIAFVPQAPALLPWRTVAANARVLLEVNPNAGTKSSANVDELLRSVGLGDFVEAYPHELSGGMQQRVGLVRAFALDAPLILMDEPFAALDELTRADMRHLLIQLRDQRNSTLVFVTHSIPEAVFLSDRVAVMSGRPGRIMQLVDVPFERPRQPNLEDDPGFFAITRELRQELSKGRAAL